MSTAMSYKDIVLASRAIAVGTEYATNRGTVQITEYNTPKDISISYTMGSTTGSTTGTAKVTAKELTSGKIDPKNMPLDTTPTVQGKGYLGSGKHKVKIAGNMTKPYRAWGNMLERCYSELMHKQCPTYSDATVCPDWLNYQTFAEWFINAPNSTEKGFQLDKDLIIPGNREYSPHACSFVPQVISGLLRGHKRNLTGLPIGVQAAGDSYRSQISINGTLKRLGTFSTVSEAHSAYCTAKRLHVQNCAEDYEHVLDPMVYSYLCAVAQAPDSFFE